MKRILSLAAALLSTAGVSLHGSEREVYLGNVPAYAEQAALDDVIRVYDTGDGALTLRWRNTSAETLSRMIYQELYAAEPRAVELNYEVIRSAGAPQAALRYGNISNSGYRLPFELGEGARSVVLDPGLAELCDWGWGVAGPHPAGSEILGWGIEFSGPAGSEIEMVLRGAAVIEADGSRHELFNPCAFREAFGALERYPEVPPFRPDGPRVYVALSPLQAWQPAFRENLIKLNGRFGGALGVHLSYPLMPVSAETVRFFNRHGFKTTMEAHQTPGFVDYLTNNKLFLTRSDGFSMSDPATWEEQAGRFPWPHHGLDYTAGDAAAVAVRHMLDRAARIGLTEYLDIDFIWPWNGRWGFGENQIAAFRRDLLGEDEGFDYEVAPGEVRRLRFIDYLRLFTDVAITPEMTSCGDWNDYYPVTESAASRGGPAEKCNLFVFVALYHYECIKFMDRISSYAASAGVDYVAGSNPEDINNANDIYHYSRLPGVRKYGYEFFGSPAGTRAWYHNMPFYAGNLRRFGKSLYIIGEINGGGHGPTRYDHRVAYAFYYDLTSAAKPSDYNVQYLENHIWDGKPAADEYSQGRWGHWAGGAYAFLQSHAEGAGLPEPRSTVAVASRSVLEYQDGMSASLTQVNNLALFLDQLHYPFDLAGKEGLTDGFCDRADILVYGPSQSSPMHLEAVSDWLAARPGRTLITAGPTPFAVFDGGIDLARGVQEVLWEAGRSYSRFLSGGVRAELPSFVALAAPAQKRALSLGGFRVERDYYSLTEGRPVFTADDGTPLISEIVRGDSRILYIHCAMPFQEEPGFSRLVADAAMRLAGAQPEALAAPEWSIHRYRAGDGIHSAVLWHMPTLEAQGKDNFYSRVPVEAQTAAFAVEPGDYLVYDFFRDTLERRTAGVDGLLTVPVSESCELLYFGPADSDDFASLLEELKVRSGEVAKLDYGYYLAAAKAGAERIFFADFETPGDRPEGWHTWFDSEFVDDPSGERVHSGRRALALKTPGSPDDRWFSDPIPADPGRYYLLRGWIRLEGGDADDQAEFRIEQIDAEDRFVSAFYSTGVTMRDGSEWREVELLFRPSPGTARIRVLAAANHGANGEAGEHCLALFDDLGLYLLAE